MPFPSVPGNTSYLQKYAQFAGLKTAHFCSILSKISIIRRGGSSGFSSTNWMMMVVFTSNLKSLRFKDSKFLTVRPQLVYC